LTTILWLKALHLFFIVAWFAGIFYLPRLFVYHASTTCTDTSETFKVMERRLWFFVTPFALLTLIFGVALIYSYGMDWFRQAGWLHVKLTLVMPIYAYHFYLFKLVRDFAQDKNTHSSRFYRFLNEAPVLVLLAVIILAVVKPLF
jgi:putative membrane protein